MGLNFVYFPFLDVCRERGILKGPLLALGSQEIHESRDGIGAYARRHGYRELEKQGTVAALFKERYGVEEYESCDLNERADVQLDLGRPLPEAMHGRWNAVLDGGTMEHIFDVRRVLENIHLGLAPGGAALHLSPLTWHNHGFYNFTPKFFQGLARANNYQFVAEAYFFQGRRTYVTLGGPDDSKERRAVRKLMGKKGLPRGILYMAAWVKRMEAPFALPYDIQED